MNALDFAHTLGGTRVNPLNAEQVKAIEAKLLNFTHHAGPLAETIQRDPEAKRNLEAIFEKVVNERRLRVFYGFKAEDCNRMEYLITRLQSLFESAYPGLLKFKGVYSPPPKKAGEESPKLPPVALVDENLLKESLAYLSGLDDLKYNQKNLSPEDLTCIKNMLKKVCARLENYPANPIPDQILENVARLFQNVNEVLLSSEFLVFRLCVERDIAVPRQILHQMSTRCQYRPEIMNKIAQQLGSLSVSPNEFLTALRDFKPDFSNEASAKASMETIAKAFKTILSFPEKERSWVNRSLEALNHHLKKIPADACPEVREFFVKEVPIKFMDKTVLCTLSEVLWLCAQSPVLYSLWMKNVEFKTPGMDFEKLGVTHDEYVALKKDLYAFGPLLKNPFLGLGLCRFLEIPALEKEYASRCMKDYQGVFEAYQRGFFPDFERFPELGKHIALSLAEKLRTLLGNPEKMVQYFLVGANIAKEARVEQTFVYLFFQEIPNILLSLRRAIEEQMFEDVKDCEYFLSELVFLLEPFECCYNISPDEHVFACFKIYEMLLEHNRIHPIPEVLERYRNKLSTIISKENFPVFQIQCSLQKDKTTHNDPWLNQKFVKKALSILEPVSPVQFNRQEYLRWFEAVINVESQPELKEIARATQQFFAIYIRSKCWDYNFLFEKEMTKIANIRFETEMAKMGRLQAALSSEEDDFILITPKLELDLREPIFNRERLTSIATHLKVDKIILKKKGWFGKEGFTGDECDEVEKIFAKFPKGTIVWM
jgi:hypothetical protein